MDVFNAAMLAEFGPKDGDDDADRLGWIMDKAKRQTQCFGKKFNWIKDCLGSPHTDEPRTPQGQRCFTCARPAPESKCAKCQVALYCSRKCQVADWKMHKLICDQFKLVANMQSCECRRQLAENLLTSMRLHLSIFATHHADLRGRGFLLVESAETFSRLVLPQAGQGIIRDVNGHGLPEHRQVVVHFLTANEWNSTPELSGDERTRYLCADIASAASALDPEAECLVLLRMKTSSALVSMPLVPDANICRRLAEHYAANKDALQIDLDDF